MTPTILTSDVHETNAPQAAAATPKKIVILGGGMSALTTAYELTSDPHWQKKYRITVYQMGWRVGGQGASGRDMDHQDRIKEHGPHIWFGFYKNAFRLLDDCYKTLNRPANAPFPTVKSAFTGVNTSVLMEQVDGKWQPWSITLPQRSGFPGEYGAGEPEPPEPTIWELFTALLHAVEDAFKTGPLNPLKAAHDVPENQRPHWWNAVTEGLEHAVSSLSYSLIVRFAERLHPDPAQHSAHEHEILLWMLRRVRDWFCNEMNEISEHGTTIRHALILMDIGLTMAIGMLADGVVLHGFDATNGYDYKQWLQQNGACPLSLNSVAVNAVYDLFFGYVQGDLTKPNIAAGHLVRSLIQMILLYRGSVMFLMNAGMGDIVVAPLYLVLAQRGVAFKFFHRVTDLVPNNGQISEVHLGRQVDLRVAEYDPLIWVKGLLCWPDRPLYEQIVQGEELKAKQINLESRWADWEDVGEVVLKAGTDYDELVLGISMAALPDVCSQIIAGNSAWRDMVNCIKTVQTQNVQLWFKPTLAQMGWTQPSFALSGYVEPLASWGNFSSTLPACNFPEPAQAHTVLYGSSVLQDSSEVLPPPSAHDFPRQQWERVYEYAREFLEKDSFPLWPKVSSPDGQIDWDVLVSDQASEQRLQSQYFRANIDPTERYIQAVAGTDQYRLKTDQSGYSNLLLTGTWINNGLSMSAVEAAVISGKLTVQALTQRCP